MSEAWPDGGNPPNEDDDENEVKNVEDRLAAGSLPVENQLSADAAQQLAAVAEQLASSPALELASAGLILAEGEIIQPPLAPAPAPPPAPAPAPPPAPDPSAEIIAAIDRVNDAVRQSGGWTDEQRLYAGAGFWTSVIGSLVGVAVSMTPLIYQWISDAVKKKPDPWGGTLSGDQEQVLDALVQAWSQMSDAALWAQCAQFSEKYNPEPGTQLLICQDIVNFSPAVDWTWSPTDKAAAMNALYTAYAEAGLKGSAVYLAVATYQTSDGRTLPRSIAANTCALAFAQAITS